MPDGTPKPRRNPILSAEVITVAADAGEHRCTSCDVLCYWGVTKNGKRVPVDCRCQDLLPDTPLYPPVPPHNKGIFPEPGRTGRGVSHFYTCPNAHQHSRRHG